MKSKRDRVNGPRNENGLVNENEDINGDASRYVENVTAHEAMETTNGLIQEPHFTNLGTGANEITTSGLHKNIQTK